MALRVRPATLRDKAAVLGISAKIWEGHDYLPLFFDGWVREGQFWVGLERGRVVGCGKATEFSRGEWWLEGLRIDPDLGGRGLGKALSFAILARALALRPRALRLATADVNEASIHIIEQMGFRQAYATRLYQARLGPARARRCELERLGQREAWQFLLSSEELAANRGLLHHTWQFREATGALVRELCRAGYVFGVRERGRLAGMLILRPHRYHPRDLGISFIEGSKRAVERMRRVVLSRAHEQGSQWLEAMAAGERMQRALHSIGLKRHREVRQVPVYEFPTRENDKVPITND
jgi:RimJ/RimL family protein N-acetyltransferase